MHEIVCHVLGVLHWHPNHPIKPHGRCLMDGENIAMCEFGACVDHADLHRYVNGVPLSSSSLSAGEAEQMCCVVLHVYHSLKPHGAVSDDSAICECEACGDHADLYRRYEGVPFFLSCLLVGRQ